MSRQDQYNVTVTIDGENLGTFDKMTGGDLDSEETKYKPGNMGPEISLGGSKQITNIVVSRLYDLNRDHPKMEWLESKTGKGQCVVTKQPLDINEQKFGKPLVYKGTLKKVTPPPADSSATTTAAMIELEISTNGEFS
jgi:hypothetical protein